MRDFFFSFKYVLSVLIIYSLLQKRVIARAFKELFGGTCECKQIWRKAKWNVSTGLIQLKIAEQKVELKGRRTSKCEAWGGCTWGDFTSRKTRRMQIRVLSEFNFKLAFRSKRTYSRGIRLAFGILWNARPGEFLKLFVHTRTCMPRHNSRWLLDLSPKQSIVWVPRYLSFPKWAILYPQRLWDMRVLFDHMHKCFNFLNKS